MAQPFPPQHHPREILNVEVGPSKEDKCTPNVELKPLLFHLRYGSLAQMILFLLLLVLVLMALKLQNY